MSRLRITLHFGAKAVKTKNQTFLTAVVRTAVTITHSSPLFSVFFVDNFSKAAMKAEVMVVHYHKHAASVDEIIGLFPG